MHVGDMFRWAACRLDELFVENTGRPFTHLETGTELRGIYELPEGSAAPKVFGLDSPDEMDVELGYFTTLDKLKTVPKIGDKFVDLLKQTWVVFNRRRKDDMVRGQNRLVLTVTRYQESVTTGGKNEQHREGTDGQGAGAPAEVSAG